MFVLSVAVFCDECLVATNAWRPYAVSPSVVGFLLTTWHPSFAVPFVSSFALVLPALWPRRLPLFLAWSGPAAGIRLPRFLSVKSVINALPPHGVLPVRARTPAFPVVVLDEHLATMWRLVGSEAWVRDSWGT